MFGRGGRGLVFFPKGFLIGSNCSLFSLFNTNEWSREKGLLCHSHAQVEIKGAVCKMGAGGYNYLIASGHVIPVGAAAVAKRVGWGYKSYPPHIPSARPSSSSYY